MATTDIGDELDLGTEKKAGPKKRLIIIVLAALLLLIGGGVAAYFFLFTGDDSDSSQAEGQSETTQADAGSQQLPALYHALDPVFVVNLEGWPKLLQIGLQVMTREQEMVDFLQENDPMIRDRLLTVMMAQQGSELKTREGKETLQSQLRNEIGEIARQQGGGGSVEALYFTSFVMQ